MNSIFDGPQGEAIEMRGTHALRGLNPKRFDRPYEVKRVDPAVFHKPDPKQVADAARADDRMDEIMTALKSSRPLSMEQIGAKIGRTKHAVRPHVFRLYKAGKLTRKSEEGPGRHLLYSVVEKK